MDAKAAAEQIRADIDPHFASKVSPEDRRSVAFVHDVASHLGLEPNHFNLGHVASVLAQHDISAPPADQYPKWVGIHDSHLDHDADGNPIPPDWVHDFHKDRDGKVSVIVHDEDEERRAVEAAADEPVEETDPAAVADPVDGSTKENT
jgi:hypothetical protein